MVRYYSLRKEEKGTEKREGYREERRRREFS
jgi:hypothetical protein